MDIKRKLDKEDIKILEAMCKKYGVNFRTLIEMVSSEIKSVNIQIRLTDEEKCIIDKKAEKLNMKRSSYIAKELEEFVNTDDKLIYEKYDLFDADVRTKKNRKVVTITLPPFLHERVKKKAKYLNIKLSVLIRYLVCEI